MLSFAICHIQAQSLGMEGREETFVADSLFIFGQVVHVLPDQTDLDLAWLERGPRNITSGYYIIIRKNQNLLCLYKDGILVKLYPVATGKNREDKDGNEDFATPEGHFRLKRVFDSTDWIYVPPDKSGEFKDVYGPWYFSVDVRRNLSFSGRHWTGIGIHGTNAPASIGQHISPGCIRLHNRDVRELKQELDRIGDLNLVQLDILP
ncbi:MAG: L,D-transpeptidase [Candidatus Syntrophosphaera sp.]|nr:L,D-transpeptidase [Candidatus Syntrophosphaera sp.]